MLNALEADLRAPWEQAELMRLSLVDVGASVPIAARRRATCP